MQLTDATYANRGKERSDAAPEDSAKPEGAAPDPVHDPAVTQKAAIVEQSANKATESAHAVTQSDASPDVGYGIELTVTDAAKATGLVRRTLRRRLDAGDFPHAHRRVGEEGYATGPWLIPVDDLHRAGLTLHLPGDPGQPVGGAQAEFEVEALRAEVAALRGRLQRAEAMTVERDRTIAAQKLAIRALTLASSSMPNPTVVPPSMPTASTMSVAAAPNPAPDARDAEASEPPPSTHKPPLAPGAPVKLTPPWEPVPAPQPTRRSWRSWWSV